MILGSSWAPLPTPIPPRGEVGGGGETCQFLSPLPPGGSGEGPDCQFPKGIEVFGPIPTRIREGNLFCILILVLSTAGRGGGGNRSAQFRRTGSSWASVFVHPRWLALRVCMHWFGDLWMWLQFMWLHFSER